MSALELPEDHDKAGSEKPRRPRPQLDRKSLLMGMLSSGFVIADAVQPSSATAGTVKPSPIAATQSAYIPKWTPNTIYALGQQVISPNNDVASAIVRHTSSADYAPDTTRWTLSATYARHDSVPFNVKAYGAIGDGITDDTAAIQATIDAASGGAAGAEPVAVRYALGPVYIPAGTYLTTAAPTIKSVIGFSITGAGGRSSIIKVSGKRYNGVTVIGCPSFVMQDLKIVGDGTSGTSVVANAGLALDWTPAQASSWGAQATLSRIYVEELKFKHGIALGVDSANYDLSDVYLIDCSVSGSRQLDAIENTSLWQSAYMSGSGISGNVLNHHYKHCTGYYVRRLYHIFNVNMVSIENGNGSYLETALYRQGIGTTVYRDARIEESRRLAMASGGASYPGNLTMENINWSPGASAAPDRMIFQWYYPGNVLLRQIMLNQVNTDTADWLLQFSNAAQSERQTNVFIDGIITTNATAQSLLSIPAGTKCYAEVRGLSQYTDAVGLTGVYVGRKTLTYYGAKGDDGTAVIP